MKDQHTHIQGYRDLDQREVNLMNEIKDAEETIARLYDRVMSGAQADEDPNAQRWAAVARTNLEIGFMWLLKSVARPTNGLGRA